jgi:hypothetical protein
MAMLAGADPVMDAAGAVTGTANSLALGLGQAHAARFVAPALTAIDAEVTALRLDSDAADDQKAAIVEAWNDQQAPWLQDMAAAIISHITTYAAVTTIIDSALGGGLQRLPDPPDALAGTLAPSSDVNLEGTIS